VKAGVLLRARLVLPVARTPIANGAVRVAGNRIEWVGGWEDRPADAGDRVVDLGDALLLPGLVNAHCHLDYTSMAGELAATANFVDWLKLITTSKAGWTFSDFAASWLAGAKMLVRAGVTTVGDVEMAPELLPDVWTATPLRVLSFLEMTGVRSRRPPGEILREAAEKIESLHDGRCRAGFSPHAPYSTTPELLRLSAQTARERKLRVAVHVAESEPEFEMFAVGRGRMFEWIARSGRDMSDCGLGSPVRYLESQGALGPELLAVHVNFLAPGDARLLARRQVSVAHCPRTHAYFKRRPFPFAELAGARVNVCLGTDSLASISQTRRQRAELNLFDEMRAFAGANPGVPARTIVRMGTVNGARALGLAGQAGELTPGAFADLIAIPCSGKAPECWDAVVQHRGDVAASMIDGEWAVAPGAA
jgi:cytosine/adenosine deaminase-related metal-dependent hydrolase